MKSLTLLLLLLSMTSCVPGGFIESEFELAKESPLPVWISELPAGYKRGDVEIHLQYCSTYFSFDNAVLLVKDRNGKTLLRKTGMQVNHPEYWEWAQKDWPARVYPSYVNVTIDGLTETIQHKKMEPIFYISNQAAATDTISSKH